MRLDGYREERVTWRRVSWPLLEDLGEYPWAVSASVEMDSWGTGTLTWDGEPPADGELLRAEYTATDSAGDTRTWVVGTFFACSVERSEDGASTSGTAELVSPLQAAKARLLGCPRVAKKGASAVDEAAALLAECGLAVKTLGGGSQLVSDRTFEAGRSHLECADELLSYAGYRQAACDPDGRVTLRPYTDPAAREPAWAFSDGSLSIMGPQVAVSLSDPVNAVRMTCTTEDWSLWASAVNADPRSPVSVPSLGYESTVFEQVSDVAGATKAAALKDLMAQARARLLDESAVVEMVEWSHPWVPLWPGDAVSVDYEAAGIEWRGEVSSVSVELGPHVACKTRASRALLWDMDVQEAGGSW